MFKIFHSKVDIALVMVHAVGLLISIVSLILEPSLDRVTILLLFMIALSLSYSFLMYKDMYVESDARNSELREAIKDLTS